MNVLWITNSIFPAPSKALNLPVPSGGGWMYYLADQMAATGIIKLNIATVYKGDEQKKLEIDGVNYYLLPRLDSLYEYQKQLEPFWEKLCDELKPDLIHIHGTEYTFGLSCMRILPSQNYVISIQGFLSIIARYYLGGIDRNVLSRIVTIQRLLKRNTIINQQRKFELRGKFEVEMMQRARHVIGTSNWDHAHSMIMNPKVNYHFCNRILRAPFYVVPKWDIKTKIRHTIFVSQAEYPLKGLHQALRAVYFLKRDFKDVQLRVAGHSIIKKGTLMQKVKISEYGVYISRLIHELDLHQHVTFTGILSESQIITEYQKAHVFVCSSSIENDSVSLSEAQILGVPAISSYVGGTEDSITQGESGFLYRFEEAEMLAQYIKLIFNDNNLAKKLSENGIAAAAKRHDPGVNVNKTLEVYKKMIFGENA